MIIKMLGKDFKWYDYLFVLKYLQNGICWVACKLNTLKKLHAKIQPHLYNILIFV